MNKTVVPFEEASASIGEPSDLSELVSRMAMTVADIDTHVGQRIRDRREALGMTQGKLGRQIGLTFSQVQKYEKGTNRIGAGRLYFLAALLGVPVHYFFEGLAASPVAAGRNGRTAADRADASAIYGAIHAITHDDTRHALFSLACALADPVETAAEKPAD